MNRKTLIALAAFAVLGARRLLRAPPAREGRAARRPPAAVAKIDPADVDTLESRRAARPRRIKNEGGKYKVTAPVATRPTRRPRRRRSRRSRSWTFGDLVTEQKAKQAEFEVDDDGPARRRQEGAARSWPSCIVGKASGAGTMVRARRARTRSGRPAASIRFTFDKGDRPTGATRASPPSPPADAEKLDVKAKDGGTIIAQEERQERTQGGEDKWDVVDVVGARSTKLDNTRAERHRVGAGQLEDQRLRRRRQAGGHRPRRPGADGHRDAQGRQEGDRAHRQQEGRRRVLREERPSAAGLRGQEVQPRARQQAPDRVPRQDALRHRRRRSDRGRGHARRRLVHAGQERQATGRRPSRRRPRSTPRKVTPIAGAFKDWKATGFAEDPSPKATGLAKPQATIVAKSKASDAARSRSATRRKDKQSYYVQAGKSPDVFTVAEVVRRPHPGQGRRPQEDDGTRASSRPPVEPAANTPPASRASCAVRPGRARLGAR